jgi:glucan-binding YG repeat protein
MREYEKEQKKKQETKKKKEEKRHARTVHKAKKHSDVYSGTLRTVGAQDVNLNMISNDDSSSIQISSYEDDSDRLSSSLNEYSPRKFPGSQLNFNQIHNLHKQKEKVKKRKIEQKQKKLRVEQELKEKEEAKLKAHQDEIMAEKMKLVQEREKQKEAHKQGLKKYEIYAIEFDWLFDDNHGRNFLVDLTKAQSLDVFSIDLIHQIIIFLWSFYRKRILLQIALPFLLYFFTFLTYATFIQNQAEQRGRDGAWYYINTICITIIFLMIIYNVYFELRKIWFYKIGYFTAYWNAVSFLSLLLNSWVMIADLNEYDQDLIRPFLAVAVLIMYVRLLYFGRMFFSTAWMVRMINSVISDSRYFLILFALSIIAFANSLAIISRNGAPPVTGGNYFDGIVYTYKAGLGEFDLDNFKANKDETILYFLWIAATFLILIVFLNLLIAIISDIFDKVHENISKNLLKELVFFMVESEFLINRKSIFKKCKYIILVNKEKGNTGEFDADSKLTVIRHAVDKQVQKHKNEVDKIQSRFSQNIHENITGRVEALESSSSKHLNLLEDKIEETEMLHGQLQSILEALNQIE